MKKPLFIALLFILTTGQISAQKTIEFPSADSLEITADLYNPHPAGAPFIVLFHQAGWSRGEYLEIAPYLNKLGFNCLAVDQRSGGAVNGIVNETKKRAKAAGKKTNYTDAYPDMKAAIDFARKNYAKGKLISWGSSYSSALVLRLAGDFPALSEGILAFAPGEYFVKAGKPADYIRSGAAKIRVPVFITSAKHEKGKWEKIYAAVPDGKKVFFVPKTAGNHGSRALWKKFPDHGAYRETVEKFLQQFLN